MMIRKHGACNVQMLRLSCCFLPTLLNFWPCAWIGVKWLRSKVFQTRALSQRQPFIWFHATFPQPFLLSCFRKILLVQQGYPCTQLYRYHIFKPQLVYIKNEPINPKPTLWTAPLIQLQYMSHNHNCFV